MGSCCVWGINRTYELPAANRNVRIHDLSPDAQPPSGFYEKFTANLISAQPYKQQLSEQKRRQGILLYKQKIQEKKQEIVDKNLHGEQKIFQ